MTISPAGVTPADRPSAAADIPVAGTVTAGDGDTDHRAKDHSDEDHRAALRRIDPLRMAEMTTLTDAPGLVRLATHAALIALGVWAVLETDGWLRVLAQFGLGVALIFLFSLCHECVHRTAFRTGWLNDRVGQITGFLIFLPAASFRYFHFAHHRYTQDPERDPELASPKPATLPGYLWRLTGWHYWSAQIVGIPRTAFGGDLPGWVPPRGVAKVRREARWHLAIYAALLGLSVAAGSAILWNIWILPLLLGQPVLRAFLMAEHTACPTVPDMLANTRTTFAHRLVRWLSWEMPYHTAHHAAPTVPFHRLGDLTAHLERSLKSRAEGYPDAHRQIVAALGTSASKAEPG